MDKNEILERLSKNTTSEPAAQPLQIPAAALPKKPVDRDTLIVRQSCMKAACDYYSGSGENGDTRRIFMLAKMLEEWCYR